MMLWCHGRGDKELQLASCPSGPTRLVGFEFFSEEGRGDPNVLEGSPPALLVSSLSVGQDGGPRSPWRWRYYASRMPDPLDVASGPRRRSLAQIESGGSSFLDKGQFLSTTTWPPRRAGTSQMEQRLPSSGLHWMTCVPPRQSFSSFNHHHQTKIIINKLVTEVL